MPACHAYKILLKNVFQGRSKKLLNKKENKTTTKFDKIYCNFSKDIQLSRLSLLILTSGYVIWVK